MPNQVQTLFNRGQLSSALDHAADQALQQLMKWNPDELLSLPDADIVAVLLKTAMCTCPVLGEPYLVNPTEVQRQAHSAPLGYGRRITRAYTVYRLHVPFTGEADVFLLRASRGYMTASMEAAITDHELILEWEGDNPAPDAVRTHFDDRLTKIRASVEWARSDIDAHNVRMGAEIPKTVAERRSKLLTDRAVHAAIGFPIQRRNDADTYTIPVTPRPVRPVRPPAGSKRNAFVPEPALAEADYEAALKVLRNARNAFERSPSMTARLTEPHIRDLLLVFLNAQFEGQAGGELFNSKGKTDILIRIDDGNVFIGECKIYGPKDGPRKITETIDQLLGYMTWRDTKGAIILLIRNRDVTPAIDKAVEAFIRHPNFKRRGTVTNDERCDFVLHANGDLARELHVALLPFVVGNPS